MRGARELCGIGRRLILMPCPQKYSLCRATSFIENRNAFLPAHLMSRPHPSSRQNDTGHSPYVEANMEDEDKSDTNGVVPVTPMELCACGRRSRAEVHVRDLFTVWVGFPSAGAAGDWKGASRGRRVAPGIPLSSRRRRNGKDIVRKNGAGEREQISRRKVGQGKRH